LRPIALSSLLAPIRQRSRRESNPPRKRSLVSGLTGGNAATTPESRDLPNLRGGSGRSRQSSLQAPCVTSQGIREWTLRKYFPDCKPGVHSFTSEGFSPVSRLLFPFKFLSPLAQSAFAAIFPRGPFRRLLTGFNFVFCV